MLCPDMGLKLITMHEPFGTWFNMIMEQPICAWLMDNCWKEGGSGDRTWGLMLCMMVGIPLLGRVKWDTTFCVMKVPPNALNVVFSFVWPWNHVPSMSVPCHCRYYLKPLTFNLTNMHIVKTTSKFRNTLTPIALVQVCYWFRHMMPTPCSTLHLQILTFGKEAKIWWKLKPSTMFLLWEKKNNKHIMLYLYWTKDLT
jgi:hypothetical protein